MTAIEIQANRERRDLGDALPEEYLEGEGIGGGGCGGAGDCRSCYDGESDSGSGSDPGPSIREKIEEKVEEIKEKIEEIKEKVLPPPKPKP